MDAVDSAAAVAVELPWDSNSNSSGSSGEVQVERRCTWTPIATFRATPSEDAVAREPSPLAVLYTY